jgi:hypothetical protein
MPPDSQEEHKKTGKNIAKSMWDNIKRRQNKKTKIDNPSQSPVGMIKKGDQSPEKLVRSMVQILPTAYADVTISRSIVKEEPGMRRNG